MGFGREKRSAASVWLGSAASEKICAWGLSKAEHSFAPLSVCVNIMFILTTQVGFLLLISYGKGRSLVSVLFAFFPPNSCCRGLKVISFKVGMIKQIPSH